MKKRTSKVLLTSIMLILSLSVMALLTGCGGPSTLEEYISENESEQAEMEKINDSISQQGMSGSFEVKENAMIFNVKLDQALTDDQISAAKKGLEQFLDTYASSAEQLIKKFEEDSKIEGITLSMTFSDKDGKEICSKEYSASK